MLENWRKLKQKGGMPKPEESLLREKMIRYEPVDLMHHECRQVAASPQIMFAVLKNPRDKKRSKSSGLSKLRKRRKKLLERRPLKRRRKYIDEGKEWRMPKKGLPKRKGKRETPRSPLAIPLEVRVVEVAQTEQLMKVESGATHVEKVRQRDHQINIFDRLTLIGMMRILVTVSRKVDVLLQEEEGAVHNLGE